jgi:hypothetical protein
MNIKHITKDGKEMFITQMEDDYLKEIIQLYFDRMRKAKKALDVKIKANKLKMALYSIDESSVAERAKGTLLKFTHEIMPYIFEACLRGMQFTKDLQELYERTGKEDLIELEMFDHRENEFLDYMDE